MSPIRLGFVGLSTNGWASSITVPPLLEPPLSSKYTITAISTTNPTSAKTSAEKYSKLTSTQVNGYHGSTEHIANDPNVDMVAISVRTPGHVDAALPALQAKKDLFIEWPAGLHLAGTREIAEAAEKNGVKTLVGFQTRHAAYIRKIKEILNSRVLGRIVSTSVVACWYHPGVRGSQTYEQYSYLTDPSNGATMVDIDSGHLIDILHHLFGPITCVTSHLSNQYSTMQVIDPTGKPIGPPKPQDDIHQIVFGGQIGNEDSTVFSVSIRHVMSEHGAGLFWVIDGEKGAIKIRAEGVKGGQMFTWVQPQVWLNGEKQEDVVEDSLIERSARYWDMFADGVQGEYATIQDALQAKQVVDAIWTSNRQGIKVYL